MAMINFSGGEEKFVTREEFPLSKPQEVPKDEIIACIGIWRTRPRAEPQHAGQWDPRHRRSAPKYFFLG